MNGYSTEKALHFEIEVSAPIDSVWQAWTTVEGIRTFFAPDANIDLKAGGHYEMLFVPDAPSGSRGGEGNRILALQAPYLLSFTWNAPPSLAEVRQQRTHVTVSLEEIMPEKTRVILHHDGWGAGGEWDQAYTYFERTWSKVVLARLQYRFEKGPIDWENPPVFK